VHADSALGLATATKQATECKVNFDGLRIDLDGFDKGLDRAIGLLVEQELSPWKYERGRVRDSLTRWRISTRAAAHPSPKNSGKSNSCQYSNSIIRETAAGHVQRRWARARSQQMPGS
jgi:hypothetical protein